MTWTTSYSEGPIDYARERHDADVYATRHPHMDPDTAPAEEAMDDQVYAQRRNRG